jgi:aminoglycoside phosphotransferase (APT) family kinase protein
MSGDPRALTQALARALAGAGFPGAVEDLRRLSGGASRETWSFDLVDGTGRARPLVMQRTRPGTVGGAPMHVEADLLRAVARAGVPVPSVVASSRPDDGNEDPSPASTDASPDLGASWMVVERVPGETIARRILRDDTYAEARRTLVRDAGAALAATHRVSPDDVSGLLAIDPLGQLRQLVDGLGEPHPAFELAFRWLDAHRPAPRPARVVHGDFRLGNLVVDETGLRAVLDWELAHAGDPREDLGWFCVRAWRFGAVAPVAGVGERDELYAAYEAAGGDPVDPEAARWWEVLGTLRWGAICMLQASVHLSGASRSVELAAIGRRTCEAEYDLFLLLEPPEARRTLEASLPVVAEADALATGHHDRPTVTELVEAVAEYVRDDVGPSTEGRVQFHARVASNVLAMVDRELRTGPALARAHAARLASVGVSTEPELAAGIRDGSLQGHAEAVRRAVWGTVLDKVGVANPGYVEASAPVPGGSSAP